MTLYKDKPDWQISCPPTTSQSEWITLAHGGGGRLTQQLLKQIFLPAYGNSVLLRQEDAAVLSWNSSGGLAFTTDSYVVRPISFPGGDIGKLAVSGTVNDLAMAGARPLYLSVGFILEEGFSIAELQRIVASMSSTAKHTNVQIVCGDTKVVEKGKGDGVYINTSGVGEVLWSNPPCPARIEPGDVVIVNGDIGRHGIAVMAQRQGLDFETPLISDVACLNSIVEKLFAEGIDVHCMRDCTRGGLATVVCELAKSAERHFILEAESIPVSAGVKSAANLLGLDPLYIANEGRAVFIVPNHQAQRAVALIDAIQTDTSACIIGRVTSDNRSRADLMTAYGTLQVLDLLSGEQLPRIC